MKFLKKVAERWFGQGPYICIKMINDFEKYLISEDKEEVIDKNKVYDFINNIREAVINNCK